MLVKFEQKFVWSKLHKILRSFRQKTGFLKTIFDKAFTPFWKTFLELEQLFNAKLLISRLPFFQCFKNYGSPPHVTRLKVAPNMADPISFKD